MAKVTDEITILIVQGVKEHGDAFVIHKNRGRKAHNAIPDEVKQQVIALKNSSKYERANFSHFQELLDKYESIKLSKSTVYRILTANGFKSPKKHAYRNYHKRRKRKPRRGMLVLMDASPYCWFFDGRQFSLHGAVDDATGEILALFLAPTETLEAYFEVVRRIITVHGVPLTFYVDRHTIFRSPRTDRLSIEDELSGKVIKDTQFGRAMRQLGINLIYATSAQAKGRIERLWETLQSRLSVELNILGITTVEEANTFLEKFIDEYNKKFAVEPEDPKSDFRPLDKQFNLDYILCIRDTRKIDNGSTFSYQGSLYRIIQNGKAIPIMPKSQVTVLKSSKIGLKVEYCGTVYEIEKLEERPKKQPEPKPKYTVKAKPAVPSASHPWRLKPHPSPFIASLLEESDREILEALYSSRLAWR